MSVIDALRKVRAMLDPRGPLGEVLSPSDVYKQRAGLGTSTPHVDRDRGFVQIGSEHLAPVRFVPADQIIAPTSRMRLASRYIEEHFTPVYASPEGLSYAEVLRRGNVLVGWNIEQRARSPHCDCAKSTLEMIDGELVHRECGRALAHMADADFIEHIQRLQIAPSDDFYNMYYPTIPGNDPVIMDDGSVLKGEAVYKDGKMVHDGTIRGGTHIKRGRSEYNQKTKGFIHWDRGFVKERERAYAADQKKWIDGVRPRLFKANKQMLPNKIGEL